MSRGQTQLPGRGVGRVTMLRISEARVKDPGADLVLGVEEERGVCVFFSGFSFMTFLFGDFGFCSTGYSSF